MALAPWLVDFYAPFDFLSILRFPNEGYDLDLLNNIGLFHGYCDSTFFFFNILFKVKKIVLAILN
jgi:hypothetical protein